MMWDRKYVHFLGVAIEALPAEKRRLGLLCVLAAFGHVCAFWLLHVSFPTPVPVRESRSRITLFTPELISETARQEKSLWYDLNDPSRLIRIQPNWQESGPVEIKLLRSPEASHARVMLPPVEDLLFLSDHLAALPKRALDSLGAPREQFSYETATQPATSPQTVIEWQDGLRARWTGGAWSLPPATSDLLDQSRVTVLRLGVNSKGEVEHVLVDTGSGKSDLDLQAADAARRIRFTSIPGTDVQWGRVSIYWKFSPSAVDATPTSAIPSTTPSQP